MTLAACNEILHKVNSQSSDSRRVARQVRHEDQGGSSRWEEGVIYCRTAGGGKQEGVRKKSVRHAWPSHLPLEAACFEEHFPCNIFRENQRCSQESAASSAQAIGPNFFNTIRNNIENLGQTSADAVQQTPSSSEVKEVE